MAWVHLNTTAQDAAADNVVDLLDLGTGTNGTLTLYETGSGIPLTANDAITDQRVISTHNLTEKGTGAFGDSTNGIVTANSIASATAGNAGPYLVTWARLYDCDGNGVIDMDVGVADATLIVNTTTIASDSTVQITGGQFVMPSGVS